MWSMTQAHSSSKLNPSMTQRAVMAQALGVLAVLGASSIWLSYTLAGFGGAAAPHDAALATAMLVLMGTAGVLVGLRRSTYPHDRLGLCNVVTATRGAGICSLAGLVFVPGALDALGWVLVMLAAITLALDGLDGWLARRSGLRSDFGARFDVESDVAFAMVLALLAWQADKAGLWFVALGVLRPAFLAAGLVWPALRISLPDAYRRKAMAAMQMTVQVVLLAPIVAPPASALIAAALLVAMILSFAADIRWQIHQHRRVK
jgi:phosphatidylglycerophosphate synthase